MERGGRGGSRGSGRREMGGKKGIIEREGGGDGEMAL